MTKNQSQNEENPTTMATSGVENSMLTDRTPPNSEFKQENAKPHSEYHTEDCTKSTTHT
jgi:hypothetical protein